MKHKRFWDLGQAQNYLTSNVIMIGKMPVFITDVTAGGPSNITLLYVNCDNPQGRAKTIDVMHKDVDLNPVSLGMTAWFNGLEWETVFLSRKPARMWKVGLHRTNLAVQYVNNETAQKTQLSDPTRNLLPSKMIADTILGNYNTFDRAKALLKKHRGMLPLSRRFAFNSKGELYYETIGIPVGSVDKFDISLNDDHKFLSEALQEDIR